MVYELRGTAMALLLIITSAPETDDGWHEVSYQEFIDQTKKHRTTISRALRLLREKGYITIDESVRGWHWKHRYKVVDQQ